MGAKKTDISQIRKYLNGELDAHAMHQLERVAQDDPFLMDALEGYEASGLKQSDLDDLDNKLAQRIQVKQRKIIPWMYMAVAASVLIVFTLGYLLWPAGQQATTKQSTAAIKMPPADHVITQPVDTLLKPPSKENMLAAIKPAAVPRHIRSRTATIAPASAANAEPASDMVYKQATVAADKDVLKADTLTYAANFAKKAKKDTTALREITIRGFGSVKRSDVTGAVSSVQTKALQGKVDGVEVTTPENHINGTIYDDLGRPLAGVNIAVVGKRLNAVTDMNGRFSVPANGGETLNIASVGFESKRVKAKVSDSVNIALKPDNSSLAEVVVTGYGQVKKEPKEAHPKMGWDNYKKYLKSEAVTTDGSSGNIRLSFTVGSKGELGDFKIISGLSDAVNQTAIGLVKKGPAWAPDASGQSKTVKLKIHFTSKK